MTVNGAFGLCSFVFLLALATLLLIVGRNWTSARHQQSLPKVVEKYSHPKVPRVVKSGSTFTKHSIVSQFLNSSRRQKVGLLLQNTFQNQHVVFVGDSLMRYQYLSFVYALKHNETMHPQFTPSIVEQTEWGSWIHFHQGTNKLLEPYEKCDCFRPDVFESPERMFENRYYYDPVLNVSATYIQFFRYFSHGHWTPTNKFNTANPPQTYYTNPAWKYYLKNLFPKHIATLTPKATIAVLNAGAWKNKFNELHYAEEVVRSVLSVVPQLIWRTTTRKQSEPELSDSQRVSDSIMCGMRNVTCMNVSYTASGAYRDLFSDHIHFKEPVYSIMNEQLAHIVSNASNYLQFHQLHDFSKHRPSHHHRNNTSGSNRTSHSTVGSHQSHTNSASNRHSNLRLDNA